MLRKPLSERRRIAADYRRRSKQMTAVKSAEIMDANDDTVVRYLRRHKVAQLIHGHTHRPALHEHRLPDGTLAKRLVLPEWHGEQAVAWADDGNRLRAVELTLDASRGDQIAAGENKGLRANPAGNSNSMASTS
jgi:UDP-2,3-diacylglucosamine hydrolase